MLMRYIIAWQIRTLLLDRKHKLAMLPFSFAFEFAPLWRQWPAGLSLLIFAQCRTRTSVEMLLAQLVWLALMRRDAAS